MSLLKYVNRLTRMDDLIRRSATGKADDFARKLGISRSQLLQDLKELRQIGAPIEFDAVRQTYFYIKDYILTPGFLVDGLYVRGGESIVRNYFVSRLSFVLVFILAVTNVYSQISGIVINSKTKKAIADVEVFINGKTPFAITNADGQFALTSIHPGFVDLVLFKDNYQLYKSSIRIQAGKAYALNLAMDPKQKEKKLKEVAVDRGRVLQMVKEKLLGKGFEPGCKVLNQEILSFSKSDAGIIVKSRGVLQIDNNVTGYRVFYYLQEGLVRDDQITLVGYYNFQPMQAQSSDQVVYWAENRLKIYRGSVRHLFKSIVQAKVHVEGFALFNQKRERLNPSTMSIPSIPNYYKILPVDTVNVTFEISSSRSVYSQLVLHGSLQVNDEGNLLISENLDVTGSMKAIGLINPLPSDYEPLAPTRDAFMRFYERIYLHTDKPYYYPGEPLWFKGYVNNYAQEWRDSLSKVVYVEIITPEKTILDSKILRMDSGLFYNDFIIPDTLKAGTYFLRAYTKLNRNFGDTNLFVRPIPILNPTEKVDYASVSEEVNPADNFLSITSDKPRYKTREKITIAFSTKDKSGNPIGANLSVSVTDAVQVIPVRDVLTIMQAYPIDPVNGIKKMDFKYPVEFGVSFSGRFTNDKGKPEKTLLNILQLGTRNIALTETNDEGLFSQIGLQFYDSASFSFKSDKAKDSPYGKVQLLQRETPSGNFNEMNYKIRVLKTDLPQRLISEYEVPKDSKLLDVIEVKATRIKMDEADAKDYRIKRPYGKPDYVLSSKDIKTSYGNLAYSLIGIVPGLIVRPESNSIGFARAGAQSINYQGSPLVTINDVPLGGDAYQIISTINPASIESIEFTKRINVLYGSQGANGVISIYTKTGASDEPIKNILNFQLLKVAGYARSRPFRYPDYANSKTDLSKPDYRSTIFWTPNINTKTGIATISFFSADLPGRYRVVAEGVTQTGAPIRCVFFIDVDDNR